MPIRCPALLGLGAVLLLTAPVQSQEPAKSDPPAHIAKLIQDLGDDSYEVREAADKALAALGVAALPAVREATGNDDPEVRRRARTLIDRWASQGEIPALLLELEPSSPTSFRVQALDTLARLGPQAKPAVAVLTAMLNDPSEFVRRMTREALAKIQPMPAVRVEISDANDPVTVGDETVYDIQVTNDGTAPATNLCLTAQVPAQMKVTQVQAPANPQIKGRAVAFEPISLDAQTSLRYRLHVKALRAGAARLQVELTMNEVAVPQREEKATTITVPAAPAPAPEPPKP